MSKLHAHTVEEFNEQVHNKQERKGRLGALNRDDNLLQAQFEPGWTLTAWATESGQLVITLSSSMNSKKVISLSGIRLGSETNLLIMRATTPEIEYEQLED